MSKFEVNDIVKCMCNEEMEQSLIEGEYYVVTETYSTASGQTNIKVALLGSDILDGICYRGIRFDKADPTNKEDVQAIVDRPLDEDNSHYEIATSFIEEAHNIVVDKLGSTLTNTIPDNITKLVELALNRITVYDMEEHLYRLFPLSEIKLGAKYKHMISGKRYFLVKEDEEYLLVDNDTYKIVSDYSLDESGMQSFIRNHGMQLEE